MVRDEMHRLLPLIVLMVTLAACGRGDSGVSASKACAPPPSSVPAPALPDGIPSPSGVVYTTVVQDAAKLTAGGYASSGSVDEVAAAYRSAFAGHSLLTLGAAEKRGGGVTMAVGGPSTQGTVTLSAGCDHVQVGLELRPLVG
jgi:hypothetical protein